MTRAALSLVVFTILLSNGAARAALVTWELTGTIQTVTGGTGLSSLGIVPGAQYVLTALIDDSVPDENPDPRAGSYAVGLMRASFRAGTYLAVQAGLGDRQLVVDNVQRSPPLQSYDIVSMSYV